MPVNENQKDMRGLLTRTIINKLQYPRLLLIYNKFIIVIKNFNIFEDAILLIEALHQ
jgi:hypothetical protein